MREDGKKQDERVRNGRMTWWVMRNWVENDMKMIGWRRDRRGERWITDKERGRKIWDRRRETGRWEGNFLKQKKRRGRQREREENDLLLFITFLYILQDLNVFKMAKV